MLKVTERSGRLYVTGTINGQVIRKSTGLGVGSETAAEIVRQRLEMEVLQGRTKGPTVGEAVADYLARAEGIGETSAAYCRRFARTHHRNTKIGTLDTSAVYRWAAGQGKKVETIRREITAVQAMLNWNAKLHGMDKQFYIAKPSKGDPRLRFMSMEEVRAMVAAASPWFKPWVITLVYTGLRRSEAAGLLWSDVAGDKVIVSTIKGRGRKRRWRTVDIHPEVAKAWGVAQAGHEPVLRGPAGGPLNDLTKINKEWSATARRAGVKDCVPHDARRTFASMLLEQGVDVRTIAELLGHTKLDMLMVYAQVRGAKRQRDVVRLPAL